jgi:hypothetical protein
MFKSIKESTSPRPLQRGSGDEYRMVLVKAKPFPLEKGVSGIRPMSNEVHNLTK